MKPRTAEQIQSYLLQPKNLKFWEDAASKYYSPISEQERDKLYQKINRFVLKAAFGEKVFRGTEGRALKAISEIRKDYKLCNDKMREIGKILQDRIWRTNLEIKGDIGEKFLEKYPPKNAGEMRHVLDGNMSYLMGKGSNWEIRGRTQAGLKKYYAEQKKLLKK